MRRGIPALLLILAVSVLPVGGAAAARAGDGSAGWYQGNISGFGSPANVAVSTLDVFADTLYAGTWNDGGAQV